jgi:hypothetical protein
VSHKVTIVAAAVAATVAGTLAYAQAGPPPPPLPPEQGSNGPPDTFLETRRLAQQSGAESLQNAGKSENLNGLRSAISANLRTQNWTIKITGATPSELAKQDVEAVAQFLATAGYSPRDVAPGAPGGTVLIQSAGRVVLGGSTFDDEIRAAPIVVLADLQSVSPDASVDQAYHSTATLRIVKSVKGDVPAGQNVLVRQRSGPASGGVYIQASGEFRPRDTGQYLLFLSPAAYEVRARRKNASPI